MVQLTPQEALSGVSGSVSLVAWICVLVPQLLENYRTGSAEGVSLTFLATWFVGDLANLFGAIWAHLVPTVVALAAYFCVADIVLIAQCLYYKHINSGKEISENLFHSHTDDPQQPLLAKRPSNVGLPGSRRRSSASQRRRSSVPEEPVLPIIPETSDHGSPGFRNFLSTLAVCAFGAAGWVIAWKTGIWKPTKEGPEQTPIQENLGAEILGYGSAVLYLGARIPQIAKNYREKSCEGLSLLFFIFSLVGNLTYGGSILLHSVSKQNVIINLPWLIGSLGTMSEDIIIFVQFNQYRHNQATE